MLLKNDMLGVVRDERCPQRKGMSRHEGVECADGLAAASQRGCDRGEPLCRGLIERGNRHRLDEGANQAVKPPRSPCLGAEAQFRQRPIRDLRDPLA